MEREITVKETDTGGQEGMSIIDSVKGFMGMDSEEDYEDYDDELDEDEDYDEPRVSFFGKKSAASKVVPISRASQSQIVIKKPRNFDESGSVVDDLMRRHPVIFDVSKLDAEEARRIVDFVAGAVMGLGGDMQRVSGGIFVAAPSQVDISSEEFKEQAKSSFDWSSFENKRN